jgi:hypothetical protein
LLPVAGAGVDVRRGSQAYQRIDGERRAKRGLAILAGQADVTVAVKRCAVLAEEAMQDLVLKGPKDDELAALRAERVPTQVLDEAARSVAAVNP